VNRSFAGASLTARERAVEHERTEIRIFELFEVISNQENRREEAPSFDPWVNVRLPGIKTLMFCVLK
jgi:hypothetical protein